MADHTLVQTKPQSIAVGTFSHPDRATLASRIPRRSVSHSHELSFSGAPVPSATNSLEVPDPRPQVDRPRIHVARCPSSNQKCCYQVFAERDAQLKKLDLPATRRVEVRQRFKAQAGDRLLFDYLVLLKSEYNFSLAAAQIRAVVINLKTQGAHLLLDRTINDGHNSWRLRTGSTSRESTSWPIVAAAEYELRFITSVDPSCQGAEAHLLVDAARVTDAPGTEVARLVSFSCVGRVRR
jgi:hypothetical protein